jgi:hypothetical protein
MSNTTQPEISPPDNIADNAKYAPQGHSVEEMIDLRLKGYSYEKIAKYVGCSKTNVLNRLEPYKHELDGHASFKKRKGDILSLQQGRVLRHMTEDKLKDMSAYQLTGMFNIFHQAERLETGQSTSNTSVMSHIVQNLHEKL